MASCGPAISGGAAGTGVSHEPYLPQRGCGGGVGLSPGGGQLFQRPHPDHRRYLRLRLSAPSDPEPYRPRLAGGGRRLRGVRSVRLSQRLRHRLPPVGGHPRRHPELSGTYGPPSWPGEPRCPGRVHRSPYGRMHRLWRRPPWTSTPSFTMYSAAPPTLPPCSRAARRCR